MPKAIPKIVRGYITLLLGTNFEGEFPKAEVALPVRFMGGRFTSFAIRVPILDGERPPSIGDREKRSGGDDTIGEVDIPIKAIS